MVAAEVVRQMGRLAELGWGAKRIARERRLAVAGDSVGGNMVAAVAILAKQRGAPKIGHQLMFYPVTDASFDTGTYRQFANGPWLTQLRRALYSANRPNESAPRPASELPRAAPPSVAPVEREPARNADERRLRRGRVSVRGEQLVNFEKLMRSSLPALNSAHEALARLNARWRNETQGGALSGFEASCSSLASESRSAPCNGT